MLFCLVQPSCFFVFHVKDIVCQKLWDLMYTNCEKVQASLQCAGNLKVKGGGY